MVNFLYFFIRNVYILLVTLSIFMVTKKRKDTVVRLSRWLDKKIDRYISDKKTRLEFPTKRNFVDCAVMRLLEEKEVNIDK